MKALTVLGASTAVLLTIAGTFFGGKWLIKEVATQDDISTCSADKFQIESRSARTESRRIILTAVVRNNNAVACGVQVSVAAMDKAGKQIAIEQIWAAGVSNIPAGGTHSFPVYLSPEVSKQAEGGDYDIRPVYARIWKQQ